MKLYGVEVSWQTARGVIHILDEKPVDVGQLVDSVVTAVYLRSRQWLRQLRVYCKPQRLLDRKL